MAYWRSSSLALRLQRAREMKKLLTTVGTIALLTTGSATSVSAQVTASSGTQALPRPDFHFQGQVGRTYEDSDKATFPQIVRPPKGTPNVVLVLLDDVGLANSVCSAAAFL